MAAPVLSDYILECRRLLHDATGRFWSDSELTNYINDARTRVAADTGTLRQLVTTYLSQGLEQFPIGGVTGLLIQSGGSSFTDGTYNLVFSSTSSDGMVFGETPTGVKDGINTAFTLAFAPSPALSLMLIYNGSVLAQNVGYTLLGNAITAIAPYIPDASVGDTYQAFYRYSTASSGTGTGAAGTYTASGGKVVSYQITSCGQGYPVAPTVSFPYGGGIGASAIVGIIPSDTLDILNFTVLWANQRIPLQYMPFTEFNARMRTWLTNPQQPLVWSRYGTSGGTAFVQPIPNQSYVAEIDTATLPNPLVDNTTVEQLAYPYTAAVAYYACWKAKYKQQAFGEGEIFMKDYTRKIIGAQASVQMRRLPNAYHGNSGAG